MTPELIISIISASTALIAVIVSPFVSYKIALKQIKTQKEIANSDRSNSIDLADKDRYANTIYNFSQKKLDVLRDMIAKIDENATRQSALALKRVVYPKDLNEIDLKSITELYSEMLFLKAKISLMLNPDSEFTQSLEKKIQNLVDILLEVPKPTKDETIIKEFNYNIGTAKGELLAESILYFKNEDKKITDRLL